MQAINCPRCGKVFTQIKSSICPVCEKTEEETFQLLKTYLNENPESTLNEVSEGTGVTPKKILRFIREGRLEITKGMQNDVRCDVCGCPIPKGRYCDECKIKLNQNITEMFSGSVDKTKDKTTDSSTMYKSHKSIR